MRIILVQEKLAKITMVTKRNEDLHNQSAASFAKKYLRINLVLKSQGRTRRRKSTIR